jgi:hypothetical protein
MLNLVAEFSTFCFPIRENVRLNFVFKARRQGFLAACFVGQASYWFEIDGDPRSLSGEQVFRLLVN